MSRLDWTDRRGETRAEMQERIRWESQILARLGFNPLEKKIVLVDGKPFVTIVEKAPYG